MNDKLTDSDKAFVSVSDAGLLYGMGLFETMRVCNGTAFELDAHLDRLFNSAKALSINNTYSKQFITEAINKLIAANNISHGRLRLTLTSGSLTADKPSPTLLIKAIEFQPYPKDYYQNGVMVVLSPFKQNIADPNFGHKTTSYMSRMISLNLARKNNAAEALWFTNDNRLAEGCISNIFCVKDSALYTPQVNTPVLPGIARKTILKLAEQNSIRAEEKDLDINDLLDADEVFLTNVIMQVMPVIKIEKHDVSGGKVGPVAGQIKKYYEDYLNKYCGVEDEGK